VDTSVRPCRSRVKRDRLERRRSSLKALLATCALSCVGDSVGAGGQLRECNRGHCDPGGEGAFCDPLELDKDRVSMRPRGCRRSGTRCVVLVDRGVDIGAEPVRVNRGSASESRERDAAGDEPSESDWCQLSDRYAVTRDQKGLVAI